MTVDKMEQRGKNSIGKGCNTNGNMKSFGMFEKLVVVFKIWNIR